MTSHIVLTPVNAVVVRPAPPVVHAAVKVLSTTMDAVTIFLNKRSFRSCN